MAREATNWRAFSRDVLRSLPAGTGYAEHQRALRAAGKLWTQERAGDVQRNPGPLADLPMAVQLAIGVGLLLWFRSAWRRELPSGSLNQP